MAKRRRKRKPAAIDSISWRNYQLQDPVARLLEEVPVKIPLPWVDHPGIYTTIGAIIRREIALVAGYDTTPNSPIKAKPAPRKRKRKPQKKRKPLTPSPRWLAQKRKQLEKDL